MTHIKVRIQSATQRHTGGIMDGRLERGRQAWECQHDAGTHTEEITFNPGLDNERVGDIPVCNDVTCDSLMEE